MDTSAPAPTPTTDVTAASAAPAETQAPASTESSTVKPKQLEVAKDLDPVDPRSSMYEPETEAGSDEARDESGEEKPQGEASDADETEGDDKSREGKRPGAQERIRELNDKYKVSETRRLELENIVAGAINKDNPDYDVDKAIADGVDPNTARVDALELKDAKKDYTQKITQLNTSLEQQANDVVRDFPFMDTTNTNRTEEEVSLAEEITNLWYEAADVETVQDEQGRRFFKQAKVPLYDFVSKIAKIRSSGISSGETTGQKNAERQLGAVEIPTGPAPRKTPADTSKMSADEYAASQGLKKVSQ